MNKIKVSSSYIPENRGNFEDWTNRLPIPYYLNKVEEADKKWDELKVINGV